MDPLTVEELDNVRLKIAFHGHAVMISEELLDRLIAAARASIPRPIAEAPMDGTVVERCPLCGYTEEEKRFHMDHYLCDAKSARGPIPKGGAS